MEKKSKNIKLLNMGRVIALLSIILLIVSAFLPWGKTANVSVNGMTGDGFITISAGVIAFILLLIKKVPLWIPLILGIIVLTTGIIDYTAMRETVKEINGNVGIGLYGTILGGAGIIVGSVIAMFKKA
jgi:hypothetical protein